MTTNSLEEDLGAKKTDSGIGNVIAKELLDFAGLDLVKLNRTIRTDVALLTTIVTFGILLHPFIPMQALYGRHGACLSDLIIVSGTRHKGRAVRGCSNTGP
jgi:hypothetical protein